MTSLSADLIDKQSKKRKKLTDDEVNNQLIQSELDFIKSIPINKWNEISKIGMEVENMTQHLKDRAINIQSSLRLNKDLTENQRKDALQIIDYILIYSPSFFDTVLGTPTRSKLIQRIDTDLLVKMVEWDTKAKVLSAKELQYIADFAYGLKPLNDFHEKNIKRHLLRLEEVGFVV